MYKKLNDFSKKIDKLKTVDPQTDENKVLKPKVLDNVGDLFNELYYIYKGKYNEEKDGLNTKNKKNQKNKKKILQKTETCWWLSVRVWRRRKRRRITTTD